MPNLKPVLIAVHGMGEHTHTSFKKEIVDALNKHIKNYTFSDGKKQSFTERATVEIVVYNKNFNTVRKRLQKAGTELSSLLKGSPKKDGLYKVLSKIDVNFAKNSFFNTHWLDVILYKEYWGEWVRNTAADQIVGFMLKYCKPEAQHDIHLLGHSLGTAVLHDTLNELFSLGINGKGGLENVSKGKLSAQFFKFDSIYMVANVSRLIHGSKHPYKTLVKPESGICEEFINIYHKLDPITWPKKFDPRHDELGWISAKGYQYGTYRDTELEAITHYDTHAITHYLDNPKTHLDLFETIFGSTFKPTEDELNDAKEAYNKRTLKGASSDVKSMIDKTELSSVESLERLAKSLEDFSKQLKKILKNK